MFVEKFIIGTCICIVLYLIGTVLFADKHECVSEKYYLLDKTKWEQTTFEMLDYGEVIYVRK